MLECLFRNAFACFLCNKVIQMGKYYILANGLWGRRGRQGPFMGHDHTFCPSTPGRPPSAVRQGCQPSLSAVFVTPQKVLFPFLL